MGLMVHSLGELPADAERAYYVYLLDYGWYEPLGEVLQRNFERMADMASRHDAVVLRGVIGAHFADQVLSWHNVNGESGEEILPAVLITTRNPHEFRSGAFGDGLGHRAEHRLLLIPLRKACTSSGEVAELIDKIFADIRDRKQLADFEVAREMRGGEGGALVDALILQPSIGGFGVDLKRIVSFFRGRR